MLSKLDSRPRVAGPIEIDATHFGFAIE
jgi:hypothetical protein